jgi:hypothetical protein
MFGNEALFLLCTFFAVLNTQNLFSSIHVRNALFLMPPQHSKYVEAQLGAYIDITFKLKTYR